MVLIDALPRYLDGPRFVQFLRDEGVDRCNITDTQKRRFYAWENGQRADIYTESCDRILTDHLLFDLIPNSVWSTNQSPSERGPKKGQGRNQHTKEYA